MMAQQDVSDSIRGSYFKWRATHREHTISMEDFASIYKVSVRDTLRLTAGLSPHLETLRQLLDLADADK